MIVLIACLAALTGCERVVSGVQGVLRPEVQAPQAEAPEPDTPLANTETPEPEADTPPADSATAGITIASLGDPAMPGMWLQTTRVAAETGGRIVAVASGASARVTLLPIPGAADAGGRLSLEAMRALGVPLTELVEVQVYPDG